MFFQKEKISGNYLEIRRAIYSLILSWQRSLSCRNQSTNLHDRDLRHEQNLKNKFIFQARLKE